MLSRKAVDGHAILFGATEHPVHLPNFIHLERPSDGRLNERSKTWKIRRGWNRNTCARENDEHPFLERSKDFIRKIEGADEHGSEVAIGQRSSLRRLRR